MILPTVEGAGASATGEGAVSSARSWRTKIVGPPLAEGVNTGDGLEISLLIERGTRPPVTERAIIVHS